MKARAARPDARGIDLGFCGHGAIRNAAQLRPPPTGRERPPTEIRSTPVRFLPMLGAMSFASTLVMVFSNSADRWERILVAVVAVFGTVIGAMALRRRQGSSAEIARESITLLAVVLLLSTFVFVAAVVVLLWAFEPGLGG